MDELFRFLSGVSRLALAKNASYQRSTASTISSIASLLSGRQEAVPSWRTSKSPLEETTGSATQVYQPSLFSIVDDYLRATTLTASRRVDCIRLQKRAMPGLSVWDGRSFRARPLCKRLGMTLPSHRVTLLLNSCEAIRSAVGHRNLAGKGSHREDRSDMECSHRKHVAGGFRRCAVLPGILAWLFARIHRLLLVHARAADDAAGVAFFESKIRPGAGRAVP